jgi:hypothetical protein
MSPTGGEMEPNALKSETASVEIPPPEASTLASLSNGRKYTLLLIFMIALFIDVASNAMVLLVTLIYVHLQRADGAEVTPCYSSCGRCFGVDRKRKLLAVCCVSIHIRSLSLDCQHSPHLPWSDLVLNTICYRADVQAMYIPRVIFISSYFCLLHTLIFSTEPRASIYWR